MEGFVRAMHLAHCNRFYADGRPFPIDSKVENISCSLHLKATYDLAQVIKREAYLASLRGCPQKKMQCSGNQTRREKRYSMLRQGIWEKPKSSYQTRNNLSASKISRDPSSTQAKLPSQISATSTSK